MTLVYDIVVCLYYFIFLFISGILQPNVKNLISLWAVCCTDFGLCLLMNRIDRMIELLYRKLTPMRKDRNVFSNAN